MLVSIQGVVGFYLVVEEFGEFVCVDEVRGFVFEEFEGIGELLVWDEVVEDCGD